MSLTRKSILVVEDDEPLRNLMESLLLMEGFEVRSAVDGPQALRLIDEQTPDLIVLDLMLPWMNGIEVLTALRQQPHLLTVPVLVTTGTATSSFDLRSFNPVRVMRKPLDVDTIVPTIRGLLERAEH